MSHLIFTDLHLMFLRDVFNQENAKFYFTGDQ